MMTKVFDYRKRGHKGTYVLFCQSLGWVYRGDVEIYSSLYSALRSMKEFLHLPQSLHDASGRLVAYTNDRKVVMCHA
jgi:hypothetical protein